MIENFIKDFEYQTNVNLKKYNTYRVNCIANYLIFPKNIDELITILKYLKQNNMEYLLLGNGSNVILVNDKYNIVIKLDRLNKIKINDNTITVLAGYPLIKLAIESANLGLSGLEFAGGIPGLVGASVAMNAGAYLEDMSSVVKEVKIIDENLKIKTLTNKELEFSYRNSIFKKNRNYICIEVTLELKKDNPNKILDLMNNRKKRRLATQPLEYPSAGSVFRNPEGYYAGALIEELGLKGYNINGAEISEKHANFIINKKNAKGSDIEELINLVKDKVKDKYNIDLILEQEIKR